MNIYHFTGPSSNVEIQSSEDTPVLTYELEGATVKAKFDWSATYDAWFKDVTIRGSADARLYGVDMTKSVKLGSQLKLQICRNM